MEVAGYDVMTVIIGVIVEGEEGGAGLQQGCQQLDGQRCVLFVIAVGMRYGFGEAEEGCIGQ